MNNMKIRQLLLKEGIRHYELADRLGISEYTLSRMLRKELPCEETDRIITIIKDMRRGCLNCQG